VKLLEHMQVVKPNARHVSRRDDHELAEEVPLKIRVSQSDRLLEEFVRLDFRREGRASCPVRGLRQSPELRPYRMSAL